MRRTLSLLLLAGLAFCVVAGVATADDADVLPKGVYSVKLEYQHSFPITKRYGPDGHAEDVAVDFNRNLDSSAFADLAFLDPVTQSLGLGNATIGTSAVSFKYHIKKASLFVARGITDKFTLGVYLPYQWASNEVSARLDTTNANVGKNTGFDPTQAPSASNPPLIPLLAGGIPLTTQDVQNMLGGGLFINGGQATAGFGFKPIASWSGSGMGDMEIGGRYQYLKTKDLRLAFTGGIRLPTGEKDDPDSLVDIAAGDGAYGILFRLNNDYTGVKNLLVNLSLRYDWMLPSRQTKRVPDSPNQPITANKEKVRIDMGDIFEFETSASYEFLNGVSGSLLYRYAEKPQDRVSGSRGFAYGALQAETDWTEHIGIAGLTYSSIPRFMEKKASVPYTVTLSYKNRFAGSNNLFKSQYLILGASVYF